MAIGISRPIVDEPANVVLVTGDGYICAWGRIGHDHGDGEGERRAQAAITVYAHIYQGPVSTTDNPITLGYQHQDFAGDDWEFDKIFGARCGPGTGLTLQTLKVWAVVEGTVKSHKAHPFYGKCASQTECGLGSGSGAPRAQAGFGAGMMARVAMLLAAAPAVWGLEALGFSAALGALFNDRWILRLRQTFDGHCVWNNGGDGRSSPLVELRCEGPLLSVWELRFRHGQHAVSYTKSADEWNGLAPNTFPSKNGGDDLFPSLTLVPL